MQHCDNHSEVSFLRAHLQLCPFRRCILGECADLHGTRRIRRKGQLTIRD
ncbi:MAG: hypothetical protein JO217_00770 [Acidobacteriaceae bacterium]|nr:hypothetical protein [Acidobacteriaceae bacterium]MBV9441201.1 hypothetical protein [Acidobacteriaceae bacterium]